MGPSPSSFVESVFLGLRSGLGWQGPLGFYTTFPSNSIIHSKACSHATWCLWMCVSVKWASFCVSPMGNAGRMPDTHNTHNCGPIFRPSKRWMNMIQAFKSHCQNWPRVRLRRPARPSDIFTRSGHSYAYRKFNQKFELDINNLPQNRIDWCTYMSKNGLNTWKGPKL